MNVFSKLFGAFILILFSATSQAQNYYVCDSTGNDNNLGRSESLPFKTYDKAMSNFRNLEGGSSILFCRGGNFFVTTPFRLVNSKCSASKPCTIGAFGNESANKPIITSNGIDAFNFENGGDAKQDGGYVVENLSLISTQKKAVGIRLFNDVDDVTISNIHIEGFAIGVYAAGSNKVLLGNPANGMNDRLIISDSTIINNAKMGFLGGCNDCLIANSHFENNGETAKFDHNIYLAHKGVHAKGITIKNNTLYKSAMVDGKCQGVSLVGHGLLEDVLIEGNIIKEDLGKVTGGCWGISIDPGYGTYDESFKNIVIRKNKIINVGGVGIGCASCDGITIESNEIIDEGKLIGTAIKVPVRTENSTKSKNIHILNNKIILSNDSASGVWVGGEHISSVIQNEIALPTNTRGECVSRNQISISIDIDSNICKLHNGIAIFEKEADSNEQITESDEQSTNPEVDENTQSIEENDFVENDTADVPVNNDVELSDSQPTDESDFQIGEETGNVVQNSDVNEVVNTPTTKQNSSNKYKEGNLSISEAETTSTITNGAQSRKASGGGSGGGSSSKSSSSSSDSLSTDEQDIVTDGVAYFETTQPINSSLNPEISEAAIVDSKTIQSTSPSITKMKDVVQAKQEDLSNIDPNLCRASANGKCLMK